MGELFRRFWLPALLTCELDRHAGQPVGFTLLSERLCAYATDPDNPDTVSVVRDSCPHRAVPLSSGSVDGSVLRCFGHGWAFDSSGCAVVGPDGHGPRVALETFPARRAGGIVWVYLGPPELEPDFPEFEWTLLPEDHFLATKRFQFCNYLQNLEGEVDTAHVNFLHRNIGIDEDEDVPKEILPPSIESDRLLPPPFLARKQFETHETEFGLVAMAKSTFPTGEVYWRMTPFLLPSYTLIPSGYEATNTWTAVVPVDDETCVGFTVTWHHAHPLTEHERTGVTSGAGVHVLVDPETFVPLANRWNDYLIDRELQRTTSFTGIYGIRGEDLPVQEDQGGPIADRSDEHLGVSDQGIIAVRRLLLRTVRDLEAGIEPPQVRRTSAYRARSVVITAPAAADPFSLFVAGQPRVERDPEPAPTR